ncbi:pseudouridine synthase [Agaribacterium haliotis]|uniref:pseudouridine synthase n=1 Tax=Agaribacterium haliotis TaxID=2013869 RepID=UPI000BB559E6|nr:pseudouridine synthase [Agaribacterium haliotis]
MAKLVLLNKPYDVLCQFRDDQGRATLADYITDKRLNKVYPAGRLDRDSEGLVLLTDNGQLQHQIANPTQKTSKEYWAQVEGQIDSRALAKLRQGLELKDGPTLPAGAESLIEPQLWPRSKPIRERKAIPTSWLKLELREGRNRQVRRMCAAVGFPCLRLVRVRVGNWDLSGIETPGDYKVLELAEPSPRQRPSAEARQKQHAKQRSKAGKKVGQKRNSSAKQSKKQRAK